MRRRGMWLATRALLLVPASAAVAQSAPSNLAPPRVVPFDERASSPWRRGSSASRPTGRPQVRSQWFPTSFSRYLGLSQRRAAAVKAYLQAKVPRLRYRAKGLGEADPVAPNTLPDGKDNPAGRQQNRRVVISYAS